MSAFGVYEKDALVDAIVDLAAREKECGKTPLETVKSIMESVSYGIDMALYERKDERVGGD